MSDRQIEWLRTDPWTIKDMDMARSIIAALEAADRLADNAREFVADQEYASHATEHLMAIDAAITAYDAARGAK